MVCVKTRLVLDLKAAVTPHQMGGTEKTGESDLDGCCFLVLSVMCSDTKLHSYMAA